MNNRMWTNLGFVWLFLLVGCVTVTLITSPVPVEIRLVTLTPVAADATRIDVPALVTQTISNTTTMSKTVCASDNLIHCSVTVPINIFFSKRNSGEIEVNFQNSERGSGLAFQFFPSHTVEEYHQLEISGTSTTTFTFMVEYKVKRAERLDIVATSNPVIFLGTSQPQTFQIPIIYDNSIDELVINFFKVGEAAKFSIISLRLLEE